jgi:hypothetical protein
MFGPLPLIRQNPDPYAAFCLIIVFPPVLRVRSGFGPDPVQNWTGFVTLVETQLVDHVLHILNMKPRCRQCRHYMYM